MSAANRGSDWWGTSSDRVKVMYIMMLMMRTMMTMMMKWYDLVGDQLRQGCLNQGDVTVLHSHHAEGE